MSLAVMVSTLNLLKYRLIYPQKRRMVLNALIWAENYEALESPDLECWLKVGFLKEITSELGLWELEERP